MERMAPARFVDTELIFHAFEFISTCDHPVGPGGQDCTSVGGADLMFRKGENQVSAVVAQGAQRCTYAGYFGGVGAVAQRGLSTRDRDGFGARTGHYEAGHLGAPRRKVSVRASGANADSGQTSGPHERVPSPC